MDDSKCSRPTGEKQEPVTEWLVGYDYPTNDPTSACTSQSTLVAYSQTLARAVFLQVTCKRWGCRFCGTQKIRQLASITVDARPTKLITLTVNTKLWDSPRAAFDGTRRRLPRLIQKIRRAYGEFEYLRVLEITKRGWPHYHFVARCKYLPQQIISGWWDQLTGAPIVDIRKIDRSADAYWYVTKYLGKQRYCRWTNRRAVLSRHFDPNRDERKQDRLGLIGGEVFPEPLWSWARRHHEGVTFERLGTLLWVIKR